MFGVIICKTPSIPHIAAARGQQKIVVQSLKRFSYHPSCCCADIEAAIGEDEAAKPQSIAAPKQLSITALLKSRCTHRM